MLYCDAARVETAEERSLDARESSQRDDCHQVPRDAADGRNCNQVDIRISGFYAVRNPVFGFGA